MNEIKERSSKGWADCRSEQEHAVIDGERTSLSCINNKVSDSGSTPRCSGVTDRDGRCRSPRHPGRPVFSRAANRSFSRSPIKRFGLMTQPRGASAPVERRRPLANRSREFVDQVAGLNRSRTANADSPAKAKPANATDDGSGTGVRITAWLTPPKSPTMVPA